ncbi:MAG: hypothetical protein ACRECW_17825 [Phyllobacterium sp.]
MPSREPVFMLAVALALAGCNSSESVLNVESPKAQASTAGAQATMPAATVGTVTTPAAPAPTSVTATAASNKPKLFFAPIVGAPVEAATPLSRRLSTQAKSQGITLNTSTDTDTSHTMKGYFSTMSEGGQTIVIYVWDVLDAAGNRVHRIQGQQKVSGSAADPWSSVPASAMEAIADTTMQQYKSWVSAGQA